MSLTDLSPPSITLSRRVQRVKLSPVVAASARPPGRFKEPALAETRLETA